MNPPFPSRRFADLTKHSHGVDVEKVAGAAYAGWAPSAIEKVGKYYLFFGANDIQSDDQFGGIGVAVSDRPEGPFKDAIGKPLIDAFHNGAQPIDQFVFRDDDGQHYLRSEEHTSELQSTMRISYAVFCLKNKTHYHTTTIHQ